MSQVLDKKHKNTAWVLGMFETGLAAARSLGRAGVPVVGLDFDSKMLGAKSRYVRFFLTPSPITNPDDLAEWLVNKGQSQELPGVLFPATDAYVLFVSRYRDALAPYFRFALPAAEIVEALIDKVSYVRLARKAGEACPATYELTSNYQAEALADHLTYPVFVKAQHAHLWRIQFDHKGFRVESRDEFLNAWNHIEEVGLGALVQEIIPGPPTNHFEVSFYRSVYGTGDILALLGVRKIRQFPPEFGVGSLVETWHHPAVIYRTLRFAETIDFRGIGNIEYKQDERSGELYLIELNARLWQQNAQATVCGINFSLIVYQDLLGQSPQAQIEFPDGIKWLDLPADVQAFWSDFRNGTLSFLDWLGSWRGVRSVASFAWDDLLPALHNIEYGIKLIKLPLYLLRHRRI